MEQISKTTLKASIKESPGKIRLQLDNGVQTGFSYEIRLCEYESPSAAFPKLPSKGARKSYWRAEVSVSERDRHYDVAGYSKDQLMGDVINQFDLHTQLLHM